MLSRFYGVGVLFSGIIHALPLVLFALIPDKNVLDSVSSIPIRVEFVETVTKDPHSLGDDKKTARKELNPVDQPQSQTCQESGSLAQSELTAQDVLSANPKPAYPEEARLLGIQGVVLVELTIDGGRLISARVRQSPHDLLSDAALSQLKRWIFPPHCRRTTLIIPIDFELL
ncbi:MAG: energy transducer TonB [Candidatus Paracaedibacteraceae bacterium]|nr:energy transducer TonB [Candidatus Paracaedibacteraceae bacterium]